jgi:hypothetical protein
MAAFGKQHRWQSGGGDITKDERTAGFGENMG